MWTRLDLPQEHEIGTYCKEQNTWRRIQYHWRSQPLDYTTISGDYIRPQNLVHALDFITLLKFQVMLIHGTSVPCLLESISVHVSGLQSLHYFPIETLLICPRSFFPRKKVGQQLHHYSLPIRPQQIGWLLLHMSWRDSKGVLYIYKKCYRIYIYNNIIPSLLTRRRHNVLCFLAGLVLIE